MNTKKTRYLIIIFAVLCSFSRAQYFEATHRQSADEINQLKTHNIREKITYIQQADNSVPFGVTFYDTGGRVVFIANPNHHEHFIYDEKGRMTGWVDSVNDGRRFEKHEYQFGYNSKGTINLYKTSTTESKFFPLGQNIQEDVLHNGIVIELRKYDYNNDRKVTLELFREPGPDSLGKITYFHKILYNKYGDLASEIVYNPLKDCKGDSTVLINTYDSKGKLIHKQRSIKKLSCGAIANTIDRKMETESVSMVYNASGKLTNESMVSSDPSLSYKKEFVYNENGILVKELGYDGKGKSTTNILYSYNYFPKKR